MASGASWWTYTAAGRSRVWEVDDSRGVDGGGRVGGEGDGGALGQSRDGKGRDTNDGGEHLDGV